MLIVSTPDEAVVGCHQDVGLDDGPNSLGRRLAEVLPSYEGTSVRENLSGLSDAEGGATQIGRERLQDRVKQRPEMPSVRESVVPQVTVAPAPYVLLSLAAKITGLTVGAMEHKIARGQWLKNREYRKGPDGRIYVSIDGYRLWVESAKG